MSFTQALGAQILAEDMRFGESEGGMEAFQNDLVVFQRGGHQETVVEDAQDEGVETVRDGGQGDQGAAEEGGEDFDKDLYS